MSSSFVASAVASSSSSSSTPSAAHPSSRKAKKKLQALPRYVVRCALKNGKQRYGAKLKLNGKQVRIGCKYADPVSASMVAQAAKRYLKIDPETSHHALLPSLELSKTKVNIFTYRDGAETKQVSVESLLSEFAKVSNVKQAGITDHRRQREMNESSNYTVAPHDDIAKKVVGSQKKTDVVGGKNMTTTTTKGKRTSLDAGIDSAPTFKRLRGPQQSPHPHPLPKGTVNGVSVVVTAAAAAATSSSSTSAPATSPLDHTRLLPPLQSHGNSAEPPPIFLTPAMAVAPTLALISDEKISESYRRRTAQLQATYASDLQIIYRQVSSAFLLVHRVIGNAAEIPEHPRQACFESYAVLRRLTNDLRGVCESIVPIGMRSDGSGGDNEDDDGGGGGGDGGGGGASGDSGSGGRVPV